MSSGTRWAYQAQACTRQRQHLPTGWSYRRESAHKHCGPVADRLPTAHRQWYASATPLGEVIRHERDIARCTSDTGDRRLPAFPRRIWSTRVRTMACLYCIAGQLDSCGGSSDALLQGILTTLRHAWQQPQYTCVRITCNDREYKTENFTPSARAGRASIEVDGKTVGWLEVDFLHGMPNRPTGNIADTDTILLTAVARCTGRALGHLQARRQLEVERESLQNTNIGHGARCWRAPGEGELELRRAVQANVDKIILPIIDALTGGSVRRAETLRSIAQKQPGGNHRSVYGRPVAERRGAHAHRDSDLRHDPPRHVHQTKSPIRGACPRPPSADTASTSAGSWA